MRPKISRRKFVGNAAAVSLCSLIPRLVGASTGATRKITVRADSEIGIVRPEFHGHFAEHLGSCVYGGLWVGKNSPIPNINGYRKLAVEYLKELGIPVLRWPGGCYADDYHWRDGIGPVEGRPKRVNIHWGGYVEDGSFGTHEFIGLCRLIGAEPYLAGDVGSGSPREMRDWVEYCNMPSGSALADERVKNGAAEPFRVRYWGVGNEAWGCGGWMRPEVYADHYRQFSVYLRKYGETEPFLIASGPNGNDTRWSRKFMDTLEWGKPDGVSMHYYEGGEDHPLHFTTEHLRKQLAIFGRVEEAIVQQRALFDSYREGSKIALVLDEWGVWDHIAEEDEKKFGKLWQQSTMRSAVAAGLGLNIFNRQANKLYMCNIAQIVNVLQSLLLTDGPEGKQCTRTTTYHAFALFKGHRGKTAVKVETETAATDGEKDRLDLSISASTANGKVLLSLVNPFPDQDLEIQCTLRGANAKQSKALLLHDADWNAYNSFDAPVRVVPKPHGVHVEGSSVRLDLPRMSVATVTLTP
jgi:alpha-N-arabinofuranosidase